MKARIIPDLPNRDYHAHRAFWSTQLKTLLRNPARFHWERENPQPPTTAMQLGSLVHTLLLEPERLEAEYLVVEAFAHDLETNVRVVKVFTVKHTRKARGKVTTLEDPRDIYEATANQGARRLRACILAVIPGDVIDAALNQCQVTLENAVQVNKESVAQLVEAFEPFGVSREMLSRHLGGKHLEKMIGAEMIQLRHIYRALKDKLAGGEEKQSTEEDEK